MTYTSAASASCRSVTRSFARRQLNLSRIESRPTKETPFEYGFHIDIAAGPHVAAIGEAMADAEHVCRLVRLIGHYPRH